MDKVSKLYLMIEKNRREGKLLVGSKNIAQPVSFKIWLQ